jgi:hypothetical protein
MLATRLLARLRDALGIEVTMLDLSDAPTIASQAALVDALLASEDG